MKIAALFVSIVIFCGCNSSGSNNQNIVGNWTVTATSTKFGDQSTATGTLAQNGSQITGSFALQEIRVRVPPRSVALSTETPSS